MNQDLTLEQIQDFKGKYPKQIWYLFLSEMWERFSFYGMRGMLIIFMVERLRISEKESNLQYGAIQAFVYALAFVGGFFADKILGFRKSIFWGGHSDDLRKLHPGLFSRSVLLHRHQL